VLGNNQQNEFAQRINLMALVGLASRGKTPTATPRSTPTPMGGSQKFRRLCFRPKKRNIVTENSFDCSIGGGDKTNRNFEKYVLDFDA